MNRSLGEALSKINFEYAMDVETEYSWNCTCEGGICRCGTVRNQTIGKVYPAAVTNRIIRELKIKKEEVLKRYIIGRMFSIHKMWMASVWQPTVIDGYYGEEPGGVFLDGTKPFADFLKEAFRLAKDSLGGLMEFLLSSEYGHLLNCMNGATWTIERTKVEDIILGQENYYMRLDPSIVASYEDTIERASQTSLPIAVCRKEGRLHLVDGYHRVAAAKGVSTVRVIVYTPEV